MKLTGKAYNQFKDYVYKKYELKGFITEVYLNALIIEWLDSVGIYVNAIRYNKHYFQPYCNNLIHEKYETRQEATEKAIEKANEIYNNVK